MNEPYRLIPTCYLLYVRRALATRLQATYLSHLETDDLGKVTWDHWDLPAVHAKDTCLVRSDAIGLDTLIAELGLVLVEGDTRNVITVIFSCVGGAPSATCVEETKRSVLPRNPSGRHLLGVKDNTGGVDHGAKEPEMDKDRVNLICKGYIPSCIEIITSYEN